MVAEASGTKARRELGLDELFRKATKSPAKSKAASSAEDRRS